MQCPSCGRPIEFEEKYAVVVACPYCNSILEFGQGELTKLGDQGTFIEFPSIFTVGKTVDFKKQKISVLGQIRYEYDGGFTDMYYCSVEGKQLYIREDDGLYSVLQKPVITGSDITLIDKIAGETLAYNGVDFFIEEVGVFHLAFMKGYINAKLIPGRDYEYLTGVKDGKKYFFEKDTGTGELLIYSELQSFTK